MQSVEKTEFSLSELRVFDICEKLWEDKRTSILDMKNACKRIGVEFVSRSSKNNECWVEFICPNHREIGIQKTSWTHFKEYENGCPLCNKISKGEHQIYLYLKNNNIDFQKEYRFKDCKYQRKLPFDFYLPKFNTVIEYNGQQHYNPVKFFGGEDNYCLTVKRDKIKKKYCEDNHIKMIIIPYWDYYNIEKILDRNLKDTNTESVTTAVA